MLGGSLVAAGEVLASSGSGDDGSGFAFIFLLSGFVFYGVMYLRYRNVHQRHRHESETRAELLNVVAQDDLVDRVTGVSNTKIAGANNTDVRGSRGGLNLPGGLNIPGIG